MVVKEGTPLPDISSVEAFKNALLKAKTVAYIDPHAGGSSGIYVAGLLEKLGIAKEVNAKAKLIHGGAVATHIAKDVAELGVHQISEILPVKGIVLVGPLPEEIQNYTTYAAGIGANAKQAEAARALIKAFVSPDNAAVIRSKGLEPVGVRSRAVDRFYLPRALDDLRLSALRRSTCRRWRLTMELAISCASSPEVGLMSCCACSASLSSAGSFMAASNARRSAATRSGGTSGVGHDRAGDRGVGRNEDQHLLVQLVLHELLHQRHVGELGMPLEPDLHQHVDLLLRQPLRPRRFP